MKISNAIVVTGGFGFIGSNFVNYLNKKGITPYILEKLDNVGEKWRNVVGLKYNLITDEIDWPQNPIIVHLGAISSTRVTMDSNLWESNVNLTLNLQKIASRFIYASSASVYGNEQGDFSERIEGLKPTNAYAFTKWTTDNYFFGNGKESKNTFGLRFFNVYGPRETHKGNVMASLVTNGLLKNSFYKTDESGSYWSLMSSGSPEIPNDQHHRDFIYVEDVCRVIWHFIVKDCHYGIYNVGTGKTRTFTDILNIIDSSIPIKYRPMPPEVHRQFQYYTKANITKLRETGYTDEFTSLEDGIKATREYLFPV